MQVLSVVVTCGAAISSVAATVTLLLTVRCRKTRIMKAASPILLVVSQMGLLVMLVDVIVTVCLAPFSMVQECILRHWLRHLSFALIYWPLLLRTWRISTILHSAVSLPKRLSDCHLNKVLAVVIFVTCLYLTFWSATFARNNSATVTSFNNYFTCSTSWWQLGQILGEMMVLVTSLVLCYRTRHAPAVCNDSLSVGYLLVTEILWTLFQLLYSFSVTDHSDDNFLLLIVTSRAVTVVTLLLSLAVIPKLLAVRHQVSVLSSASCSLYDQARRVHRVSVIVSETGDVKEIYCVPCGPLLLTEAELTTNDEDFESAASPSDAVETQYTKKEVDSLINLVDKLKYENTCWKQRFERMLKEHRHSTGNDLRSNRGKDSMVALDSIQKLGQNWQFNDSMVSSPDDTCGIGMPNCKDDSNICFSKKRTSTTLTEMTSLPRSPDSCTLTDTGLIDSADFTDDIDNMQVMCSRYVLGKLTSRLLQGFIRQPSLWRHSVSALGLELQPQAALSASNDCSTMSAEAAGTTVVPATTRNNTITNNKKVFCIDLPYSSDVDVCQTNTNLQQLSTPQSLKLPSNVAECSHHMKTSAAVHI